MLQKGIVEQVIDKYSCKVRIPKYNKLASVSNSTSTEDLATGILCALPGTKVSYVVGDIVLVAFENDELSKPVILGLLYREAATEASISIDNIDESLSAIQENLDTLNNSGLYTHIKYSNDNGVTFTSLYNYNKLEEKVDSEGNVYCTPKYDDDEIDGIKISNYSKYINWCIIDSDNKNVTENLSIETTIFDSNDNIIRKAEYDDKLYNIEINNSSQIDGQLYVNYKIFASKDYLKTLHITLNTDKNALGDTVGNYVGLCVGYDSIAPTYLDAYKWFSCNSSFSTGGNVDLDEIYELLEALSITINNRIDGVESEIENGYKVIEYIPMSNPIEYTQAQVNVYCKVGYAGTWGRRTGGWEGAVVKDNVCYIIVKNTGSTAYADPTYGRLSVRVSANASAGASISGTVIGYEVSGEMAIDALVVFKNNLLNPGSNTYIAGGAITTNSISADRIATHSLTTNQITTDNLTASSGVSWINLNNGTFFYATKSFSEAGATGISWDGTDLVIKASNIQIDQVEVATVSETISSATVYYLITTNESETPEKDDSRWNTATPTWAEGSYIWTLTEITYADSTTEVPHTERSNPVRLTGNKGSQGQAGAGYTIVLTNESHTFAGTNTHALASTATCVVIGYKDTAQLAVNIGTISGLPSAGMSCQIFNQGTTSAGFIVTVTEELTTASGVLTVPVTMDGQSFTKKFSYSVSFAGEDGESSTAYMLDVSAAAISKNNAGVFSPSHLILTGKCQSGDNPISESITLTAQEVDYIWSNN